MSKWFVGLALSATLCAGMGCDVKKDKADGSGTIECTQVQVAPSVAGRILDLPAEEGSGLKKNELVVRLDSKDYELRRAEADAALKLAEAQLALLLAGSRAEDIQRAQEMVREARASAEAAMADFERIRQVFEKKSVTQKQFDDAKAAPERTQAAWEGAKDNLDKIVKGSREEDIRIAEAQVELARTRLAQTEKAIADCTVLSPMDGMVTTRVREEGEWILPGSPVIILSRLDEVWLSLYVPEPQVSQAKIGQAAWVKVDGSPQIFEGVITFVSPEAEFTPRNVQTPEERAKLVYRLKITLKNPDGVFKPGMPADGYITRKPQLTFAVLHASWVDTT